MKKLFFFVKVAFIVCLFGWIAAKFDYKSAGILLSSARLNLLVFPFLIAAVSLLFINFRWKMIIRGFWEKPRSTIWQLFYFNLLGIFYTLFVPTSIAAEAVRVWRLAKNEDGDYGKATMTAIIDKLVGLATWFVLFLLLPSQLPKNKLLLLVFFVPIVLYLFKDKLIIKEKKIFDFSRHHPMDIIYSVLYSFICQLFYILMGYMIFKCLNINIDIFWVGGIMAAGALVGLIPVSLLGFGVREGFFVATLPLYGTTHTEAVMVTTFLVVITYLTGLSGGIIELARTGWNISNLKDTDARIIENEKN
ncbi:MAG: hypothetical protein A2328_02475 [Bdellovibrionales bacterium RIFOXYB2_FULL_36_6]|nr:MAG: hypothetical protein A2328_02475 [Bdellovibrionales bacterium RIFOXYB2_FULL_36_6]